MPHLRPRLILMLCVGAGAALAALFAATGSGSHGPQRWAGQWEFIHGQNSPTPGTRGGFALQHRDDENGQEVLENIGGVACTEPTDYFAGAYTVPDSEDKPATDPFVDTGRFRGCTVGDPDHLSGRYESDSVESTRGEFDLVLDATGEHWTGTFTVDGDSNEYSWSGFFENHFDDGAEDPSIPPYAEEPPVEPPVEPPLPSGVQEGDPVKGTCHGQQATITADPDNPPGFAVIGTTSRDVILGSPGKDRILALAGNDLVCGLGGDDEIFGADGDDFLFGEDGADLLDGGVGNDTIEGGAGDDQILGGNDQDELVGEAGSDLVRGGNGEDRISGGTYFYSPEPRREDDDPGPDNDQLFGDAGGDSLHGGRGNDVLRGGPGGDVFTGGSGNDKLYGEGGDDKFSGFAGNDLLDGAGGTDTVTFFDSPKPLSASLATGRVVGDGRDTMRGIEKLVASDLNDILIGSALGDFINGWGGNDVIWGGKGSDHLIGHGGDDKLFGQGGFDRVDGGGGSNLCAGERRSNCDRVRRDTG